MRAPFTVLKQGEIFVVSNERGDIGSDVAGAGIYFRDTRYLSECRLTLNDGLMPDLLDASAEHNAIGIVQFGNPYIEVSDGPDILPNTVSIRRYRIVDRGVTEQIELHNYNARPVAIDINIVFSADFRDIFDIRGFRRQRRGDVLLPRRAERDLVLGYRGVDDILEETIIRFNRTPDSTTIAAGAGYTAELRELATLLPGQDQVISTQSVGRPPSATVRFHIEMEPGEDARIEYLLLPGELAGEGDQHIDQLATEPVPDPSVAVEHFTAARTDNTLFNRLLDRSLRDIRTLTTPFAGSRLVAAGIPWYVAPFGRDSLIVGLQMLMFSPDLALQTLRFLADRQGTKRDPWTEEEPGKILHEQRFGEMARRGEIPHVPYYGTNDATPLFIMLFGELMRWIGSEALLDEFRPNLKRALEWIDQYGDTNGDGFVDYGEPTRRGLVHRGWKDSDNSLPHPNGQPQVESPVALIEIQGYVYQAKLRMAEIYAKFGEPDEAARLHREAAELAARVEERFWDAESQFYGQAVDGAGDLIPWISSNPGHGLYTGIIAADRAAPVVERLHSPEMYSGWGIRTLSTKMPHYNPMSYHNGSVWPHDNSLIVAGMRRYGFDDEAVAIISDLVDAAQHFEYGRLPELFCGFSREFERYTVPISYPVSCSPQAWAAATIPFMLQVMLGIEPNAVRRRLTLRPCLPDWLEEVELQGMRFADGTIDLKVRGHGKDVEVELRAAPDVDIYLNDTRLAGA